MTSVAARSLSLQFALRSLLDHVADAVMVVSSAGKLLYANAAGNVILDDGDGLQLKQRHLHATNPKTDEPIARTLEATAVVRPKSSPLGTREATIRAGRHASGGPLSTPILARLAPRYDPIVESICAAGSGLATWLEQERGRPPGSRDLVCDPDGVLACRDSDSDLDLREDGRERAVGPGAPGAFRLGTPKIRDSP